MIHSQHTIECDRGWMVEKAIVSGFFKQYVSQVRLQNVMLYSMLLAIHSHANDGGVYSVRGRRARKKVVAVVIIKWHMHVPNIVET